ncbi:hypothetical protein [Acinetobacter schindleri]|uniref:hypothetical protein n=1 Tax=Acinetobacter schindleri TaxID=108981 RepID=UPI000972C617|nr:hypothetical protein [Acinetobacter schindleri]APX62745.1 hypothetical protein AsACE_CH01343 [Acinetobacter schindleri]
MQFTSDVVVRGSKPSKGEYNGTVYNSTKVYIDTEMQAGERSSGQVTSEYTWGTSENYDRIEKIPHPFKAKAIMQIVSNGRDSKTILVDLIPEAQPAAKSA